MEKGNGEGEVSLQATWDQGGQGLRHTERRDSKSVMGTSIQGELLIKGNYQGELSRGVIKGSCQGVVPCAL